MKIYCNKQNHNFHPLEYEIIDGEIRVDVDSCLHCRRTIDGESNVQYNVTILSREEASEFVSDMENDAMPPLENLDRLIDKIRPLIRKDKKTQLAFAQLVDELGEDMETPYAVMQRWYHCVAGKKSQDIIIKRQSTNI